MSIKKIAERAGVSPSTVSRILNNPDYNSPQPGLRDKVWKIAMEMNYSPNEAARNLRLKQPEQLKRTICLAVLMTRTGDSTVDPFYAELLRVIESEIHRNACILSKVWYMSVFSDDRKCRSLDLDKTIKKLRDDLSHSCDGLLVIGKCNKQVLSELKKNFKNIVSVNRNSTNYEVDEVLCDGKKIAQTAVEYLISLGHKEIAYVGACRNESRYKGYQETLERNKLDVYPEYVVETKQTEAEGYEVMKQFLQMSSPPTGIYCANDISAIGMLICLRKFKNRYYYPSVIASDNIEAAQTSVPMLTTVSLPKEEMGKMAVFLLLDRIRGAHKSVMRLEVEGTLIKRQSCTRVEECHEVEYYI